MLAILFSTSDPSLGRVDRSTLSDQMMLELLVQHFTEDSKRFLKSDDDAFLPVCTWACVNCDASERAISFDLKQRVAGSLVLAYIPLQMQVVNVRGYNLEGTLDTENFPDSLQVLSLTANKMSGSVDMTQLPPNFVKFNIGLNDFSGTCDLRALPERIEQISLDSNKFHGSIHLDALPTSLRALDVSRNAFSGEVCFEHLPPALTFLELSENQFEGSFALLNPPANLAVVNCEVNKFAATAVVKSGIEFELCLNDNTITAVVDANGDPYPDVDNVHYRGRN